MFVLFFVLSLATEFLQPIFVHDQPIKKEHGCLKIVKCRDTEGECPPADRLGGAHFKITCSDDDGNLNETYGKEYTTNYQGATENICFFGRLPTCQVCETKAPVGFLPEPCFSVEVEGSDENCACDPCPGAVLDPETGHYYKYVKGTTKFDPARIAAANDGTCWGLHGHLATITTPGENDFLSETFPDARAVNAILGGYYADGAHHWVTGEVFDYVNWAPGQPDGDNGLVHFWGGKGQWNNLPIGNDLGGYIVEFDNTCDVAHQQGCQSGHQQAPVWKQVPQTTTWANAKTLCEADGMVMCSRADYCPNGHAGGEVPYGQKWPGDQWAATSDHNNSWVQVGNGAHPSCKSHEEVDNGKAPAWGPNPAVFGFRNKLLCCPVLLV